MVVGRPVIGCIYAGLAEFMTLENSYPVNYQETPCGNEYEGPGDWAQPDSNNMIQQMRKVYLDRQEARKKGELASKSVEHLTWEHSAKMIRDVSKAISLL